MRLRALHRTSALVLLAFTIAHIANHLVALQSISAHVSFMSALRMAYRHPIVEALLLLSVLIQLTTGLWLIARRWSGRVGGVAWLQAVSGAYLALFLSIHVAAVLFGRSVLGLDTNFYFAAAGFHVPPFEWFFAPYYALGVLALFAHLGCAVYWQFHAPGVGKARIALVSALVLGSIVSLAITLSLAGKLRHVSIPAKYKATYGAQ